MEDRSELYTALDELVKRLVLPEHGRIVAGLPKDVSKEELKELLKTQGLCELDEKQRQVAFTEAGNELIEELLREQEPAQGRFASTTSRTSRWCTTPTRRSRPTPCSCATATTS